LPNVPHYGVILTNRESINRLAPGAYQSLTEGLRCPQKNHVIVRIPPGFPWLYDGQVFDPGPADLPGDPLPASTELLQCR